MPATDSLKVIAIAGRTDSAGTAATDQDQEETRLLASAVIAPGYLPNMLNQSANPNAFRVRQNTGSDMNVKVGSGTTKVDGYAVQGTVAGQGTYIVRLDATTVTLSVPAADATNPARYGVYLFINDTAYGGTANRAYVGLSCIRGTPAGSPTTPGPLAAWSAYALLWEFQLAANATAVTNTILDAGTDDRVASAVPMPSLGPRPFTTTAKRTSTVGSPVEAQQTAITGEDRFYTYDGSAWQRTGHYSSSGRTGGQFSRATSLGISATTLTTVTMDTATADSDAFHSGSSFNVVTVPTGLGGWYIIQLRFLWSSATQASSGNHFVTINGSDTALGSVTDGSATTQGRWFNVGMILNAADTIGMKVYSVGASTLTTAALDLIRIGL